MVATHPTEATETSADSVPVWDLDFSQFLNCSNCSHLFPPGFDMAAYVWIKDRHKEIINNILPFRGIYTRSEYPIMTLGLIGNLLGLVTLLSSRRMRTSHFMFFRILTSAELAYCVNYFLVQIVSKISELSPSSPGYPVMVNLIKEAVNSTADFVPAEIFKHQCSALYRAAINRVIVSFTGYTTLYMTSLIALERFAVVKCPTMYHKTPAKKRGQVTWCIIGVALLTSFLVHAWDTPFENIVTSLNLTTGDTIFLIRRRTSPKSFLEARRIKDFYNATICLIYPVLLLCVTSLVIHGMASAQNRRRRLQNNQTGERERSLFYLMLMLCAIAFVTVLPREANRVLNMIYPEKQLRKLVMRNGFGYNLDKYAVVRQIKLFYYGHIVLRYMTNMTAFLGRSLTFYMYFLFNSFYRNEVLTCFGCRKLPCWKYLQRMSRISARQTNPYVETAVETVPLNHGPATAV